MAAHLVGDVHQPLHATSAFSVSEPHGDGGGNNEKITCVTACQETTLHWLLDDAPGTSDDPDDAIALAKSLPAADARQATARDESIWIEESFELAMQVVYQQPISVGPDRLRYPTRTGRRRPRSPRSACKSPASAWQPC